jgi:hypothetical protein
MKALSDYTFYDAWQLRDLPIRPLDTYRVLADVGQLKQGQVVKFVGFDDVDNHYGVFVFTDADGNVLEVSGDFSGPSSLTELRAALAKA